MSTALVIAASAAQEEGATLFVGFECKVDWLIGLYAPELGTSVGRHKVVGGDLSGVQALIQAAKQRLEKVGRPVRVVRSTRPAMTVSGCTVRCRSLASRTGSSTRRACRSTAARRVKTDRLDLEQLIRMLLALKRGETRACRVVRVPSPAEEEAKRQHRERAVLVADEPRTAIGSPDF